MRNLVPAPALTPEQWAALAVRDEDGASALRLEGTALYVDEQGYNPWGGGHRHALAALALHGQPFGFTWEDHDRHQRMSLRARGRRLVTGIEEEREALWAEAAWHDSMAARIAALLPPRDVADG